MPGGALGCCEWQLPATCGLLLKTIAFFGRHHTPGGMGTVRGICFYCMMTRDTLFLLATHRRPHLQHVCERTAGSSPPLLDGGSQRIRTPQQLHERCTRLRCVAVEREDSLLTSSPPGFEVPRVHQDGKQMRALTDSGRACAVASDRRDWQRKGQDVWVMETVSGCRSGNQAKT